MGLQNPNNHKNMCTEHPNMTYDINHYGSHTHTIVCGKQECWNRCLELGNVRAKKHSFSFFKVSKLYAYSFVFFESVKNFRKKMDFN